MPRSIPFYPACSPNTRWTNRTEQQQPFLDNQITVNQHQKGGWS